MVNVSKRKVNKGVFRSITNNLVKYIAHIKTKKQADTFIDAFFTQSEQKLFAKRFALIVMLERGYSYSEIADLLKVSYATIAKIEEARERGDFKMITTHVQKACKLEAPQRVGQTEDVGEVLETILRMGMPPMGRGRWKKTLELIDKE